MKLSLAVLTLLPAAAFGQTVSQPECQPWTKMHLYDTNADLQPAEDAYAEMVAASLETDCMDGNVPKECSLGIGQSDAGDKYTEECTKNGGKMWTYTFHPLCGDISSTSQTEISGILVCASASCEDIGVSNLIPNQGFLKPFVDAGLTCGSGTGDVKAVETEPLTSQPECYNYTQMHLYDTNPDMQPTEDAYFQQVANTLEAKCMEDGAFTGCGDFDLDEEDFEEPYIAQCHKTGGHIWTYKFSPLCGNYISSDQAGLVSGMLVCASASCVSAGNLIPPQEVLFAEFAEAGYSCASATQDLEKSSVPNTQVEDSNSGQTPSGASSVLPWMPLVSALAAVVAF